MSSLRGHHIKSHQSKPKNQIKPNREAKPENAHAESKRDSGTRPRSHTTTQAPQQTRNEARDNAGTAQ
jgi:hypothetical protein